MNALGAIDGAARQVAGVTAVVRDAAARTGVDFDYLLAQARVESGLDPAARARTSSARGLYQFTSGTWLATVRKHGGAHGLGWAAEAIAGGAAKAGSAARATILALRDNAEASALMAGAFARDNGAALEQRLGRAAGATELYLAHFLGAAGAGKFLGALARDPGASAAGVVPEAAAANRSVFFGRDGAARTVGEVFARFADKLGRASEGQAPLSPLGASAPSRPLAQPSGDAERQGERGDKVPPGGNVVPAEQRARMAYLLLAELGA